MNLMFLDLLELTVFPQIDCSLIFSIVFYYDKEFFFFFCHFWNSLMSSLTFLWYTPFYPGASTIESSTDTNYCRLKELYLQLKRELHTHKKEKTQNTAKDQRVCT